MAETTAFELAEYLLFVGKETGLEITNLKLQKLLYYCQSWHLAITGSELFSERIEAWVHGPVVPPVFGIYKEHRWGVIPCPSEDPGIRAGRADRPIRDHVIEVLDVYGTLTGPELESPTHKEDPWRLARKGLAPDVPSNAVISSPVMREYYRSQLID